MLLSLPNLFTWSRQPAAGHPRIVGANIHTLPDGMSPGQKPRLPLRWLGSSYTLVGGLGELLFGAPDWIFPFKGKDGL